MTSIRTSNPLRQIATQIKRSARFAPAFAAACHLAILSSPSAFAQSAPRGIIRDTEIENLVRDYANPIFKTAGISKGTVEIILLGDRSFNAFVTNGRRMFINIGALMDAKTPNEIIGVIAHETGHITGGHLTLQRERLGTAQIIAVAGMLLGAGAMVAGARQPSSNSGKGGMGVMLGAQELAYRTMMSYQRGEEQAADRAAIRFLDQTGQSGRGVLETFRKLSNDSMFKLERVDPYLLSHPIPQERIANLESLVMASPDKDVKDPASLQARHDMMRAKLYGFAARSDEVNRRYPQSDLSLPARYARAIMSYRLKRFQDSLAQIDDIISSQPDNPYFHELKGQVLLESGRPREAIAPLRRALTSLPNAGLIRTMLGHAMLSTDDAGLVDDAISELSNATQREPNNSESFELLARAYARKDNIALAEFNTAQAAFISGDYQAAMNHAARAKTLLPPGSPAALKAEDILNYKPPRLK